MGNSGVTWRGDSIDDIEILLDLPADLRDVLTDTNGFILQSGALHVRGASLAPEWHSLRTAWRGPQSFFVLYPNVKQSDIPFAQDQVGDQLLLRGSVVVRLFAETGDIEFISETLHEFFRRTETGIEEFLNMGLSRGMEPGQLLHAYPPFCTAESSAGTSLKPLPASEVIFLHAELAKAIRNVPDGDQIRFKPTDS